MCRDEPIPHAGCETLSFFQIDSLNGFTKGTAFKLFKAGRQHLLEGRDYFYLPAAQHADKIQLLKTTGQIYATTVNLVLVTRPGYDKLRQAQGFAGSGA